MEGASDRVPSLPGGTVTLVLDDVEGSVSLWERDPDAMRAASCLRGAMDAGAADPALAAD